MNIRTLEVAGIAPAIIAMRNPMNSWDRIDSIPGRVGKNDKALSIRLAKAGTEHCKHLRMIVCWADITAPFYWWKQADCYRIGVEKVSCSTMHKLMSREVTIDDFEHDAIIEDGFNSIIDAINGSIREYSRAIEAEDKAQIFRGVIQLLPESYLQKRTVMMSYAALRGIYRQRKGHKLPEWQLFREWVESLPESWMITDKTEEETDE
jgi:hypothetical protein